MLLRSLLLLILFFAAYVVSLAANIHPVVLFADTATLVVAALRVAFSFTV